MGNPSFRVRSVYDIPIVKIIIDEVGYKLVQPTPEQSKLFNVEEKIEPYDIEIKDIMNGYGISIEADEEYVEKITSQLHNKVPNSIILKHPIQLHAVYNGQIVHVNSEKNLNIVDIGENIDAILFGPRYRRGEKVVVQIKELNILEDQLPVCATTIHFAGETVILERDAQFVRVSRKLPKDDRDRLFELGKKLRPHNSGLIMRTSAVTSSDEEIQADIENLVRQSEELDFIISGSSYGPGILQPGHSVAHVLFDKEAKAQLTVERTKFNPTIPDYYWFMSYSPELALTTSFAEIMTKYVDRETVSKILKEMIIAKDFPDNALLHSQEYRLTSPSRDKVIGQITWDNNFLIARRSFRSSRGTHQGIEENIFSGDSSEVITKEGSWTLHTKITRNSTLVGEHVKVVAPVELYNGGFIRYIDLGLMVAKQKGEVQIIDTNVLNSLMNNGIISSKFVEKVKKILEICKEELEKDTERIVIVE